MHIYIYDRVNRESLWQVLRMYDVGGNLLNSIKNLYVSSLVCVRVKGGENVCFMIDSGVELCRRRGLKVKAGKSKVMMLGGREGLVYEVSVHGICLEHVSEFKYLGSVLDESGTDKAV